MVNAGSPMRLQHILVPMPTVTRIEPRGRCGMKLGALVQRSIVSYS